MVYSFSILSSNSFQVLLYQYSFWFFCFVLFTGNKRREVFLYLSSVWKDLHYTAPANYAHSSGTQSISSWFLTFKCVWFARVCFAIVKNISTCKTEILHYNFIQLFCFYFSLLLVFSLKKKTTHKPNPEVGNFPPFLPQHSAPRSGSNKDVCPVLHSLRYPKDPENHFHHEA